ncbi:MAG: DNA-deoxyinosine glycosylase [Candidatus Borkfalkiaceae bacterium]|nr:DNA-deoxyinosine glycosylase [Christensenellaceae bacterium]
MKNVKHATEKSATARHNIPPVFDGRSTVLILGSFPSVASREEGFFYAHPQNRFWKVLSALFSTPLPRTTEEKKTLLLTHGVALFDVIARCEISGSADSSVKDAVPNDLTPILSAAPSLGFSYTGKRGKNYI